MVAIKKVVLYVIPIVVMILLLIFYPGTLSKIKGAVNETGKYVSFGVAEELGAKPTIPEAHQKALDKLLQTMKEMRDSKVNNCFANYGGLPPLGEKGTSFTFSYDAKNDRTIVTVRGGKEGAQELSDYGVTLEGIKPCVIAGGNIPKNFYYSFLSPKSSEVDGKYYQSMSNVVLKFEAPYSGANKNVIRVGIPDVDEESDNFEDQGWLFTPDNKNICFFPTSYGACEPESDGLQRRCFINHPLESYSIPELVGRDKLSLCNEEKGFGWIEAVLFSSGQGTGVVRSKCPVGSRCQTYQGRCNTVFSEYKFGRGERGNCLLLAYVEDEGCGYAGVKPGSTIKYLNSNIKIDHDYVFGENIVPVIEKLRGLTTVGTDKTETHYTCADNGLWNVKGISFFKTENYYDEWCEDKSDNDGDGKIDCYDSDCFSSSSCKENGEMGISKSPEFCFDTSNNEGDYRLDEKNEIEYLTDCKDPECEGIVYEKDEIQVFEEDGKKKMTSVKNKWVCENGEAIEVLYEGPALGTEEEITDEETTLEASE